MFRPLKVLALSACILDVSCSGQQGVPSGSTAQQASLEGARVSSRVTSGKSVIEAVTNRWGLGLKATHSLNDQSTFNQDFCQDAGYTFASCPSSHAGKRRSHYSQEDLLSDTNGTYSFTASATAALGTLKYSENVSGKTNLEYSSGSASGSTDFMWLDNLMIHSTTLPKGTPVTLNVSLTLNPTITSVDCNDVSKGSVTFTGPGTDANGNPLSINGSCGQSGFYSPAGTQPTDTGVLNGAVGQLIPLEGSGSVSVLACGGLCVFYGLGQALLAGSVTWTITSITPGATYTTRSGVTYN